MSIGYRAKLAAAALAALAAAPLSAHAEVAGGVIGCDAPGGKQMVGAGLGAVLGGIAGSNLASHNRTTGTVLGATAGAAAGSYVGCNMQKSSAQKATAAPAPGPVADRDEYRDDRPVAYRDDGDEGYEGGPPGLAKKPHHMPPGQAKKYGVGQRLPSAYLSERRYYLSDPRRYGLRYAPAGYRWVAVDRDAYLVRTRTGLIAEIALAVIG